jgi:AraC-like DNA-binding protein
MEPALVVYRTVPFPIAWYREFAPCKALQADVYAFFSFVPEPIPLPPSDRPVLREIAFYDPALCAPQFADGHVSLTFELGHTCNADGRWFVDSRALRGTVVGPLREVGRMRGFDLPATIGVFFRPGRVAPFLRVAISELTDEAVAIDDIWGAAASRLPGELGDLDEAARVDRLESVLLARLRQARPSATAFDVEGLARNVLRHKGRVTVEAMARSAGVSRQYLAREFRARIGIGPKLYSRLARFQSGLAYAGIRKTVDWASVALDMGYVDQSHMIAEFRLFSGLTPRTLASREWFHPFIVRTKSMT